MTDPKAEYKDRWDSAFWEDLYPTQPEEKKTEENIEKVWVQIIWCDCIDYEEIYRLSTENPNAIIESNCGLDWKNGYGIHCEKCSGPYKGPDETELKPDGPVRFIKCAGNKCRRCDKYDNGKICCLSCFDCGNHKN